MLVILSLVLLYFSNEYQLGLASPPKLEPWQESLLLEQYLQEYNRQSNKRAFGGREFNSSQCNLSPELKEEIRSYGGVVDRIIEESMTGAFEGRTYQDLAYFADTFGHRLSGTDELENAITYLESMMTSAEMDNVHEEEAVVPKWIRGEESAEMLSPRKIPLQVRGLGFSVPTPDEGITAEVVLVRSFRELREPRENYKGKIIVYNARNGEGPLHVILGAAAASKVGALAALARSATTYSLYSVHASVQFYDETVPKIPVAAITLEDGDMIERMVDRGENVTIHLTMKNLANDERVSRNVIGDYTGSELPEEYVMLAGHSDSWDSGQGVLDDGVGPILAMEVVNLLKFMGLQPRRTIRNVFFTGEEAGLFGARRYVKDHRGEMEKYNVAMEADYGCLQATGLLFSGTMEATCIVSEIMKLYEEKTEARSLVRVRGVPTDIYLMNRAGVPGIVLNGDDGRYIWYHHTQADTMTAVKSQDLDKCLAVWTSTAYVLSDLKEKLPREENLLNMYSL